jgi:hypothetical protein
MTSTRDTSLEAATLPAAGGQVKAIRSRSTRRLPFPLSLYESAVGKKWVMALTGIALLGFMLVHMIGNLHLYEGPRQVNAYGEALRDLGVISPPARSCCGCCGWAWSARSFCTSTRRTGSRV